MGDAHPRQEAQLDGGQRHRKGASDDGLRGNDRGGRGQHHQHRQGIGGDRVEERIGGGGRIGQNQRALAKIVEHERRKDQRDPGDDDGFAAKMAEVGIKRLCPGDGQKHRAQHDRGDGQMTA